MKTILPVPLVGLAAGLLLLAGCGTPIQHAVPLTKAQILEQPDVKNKPPTVFPNTLEEVRIAGLRALNFVGCEVKTQEPLFLAGIRPQKWGLFVGSGGETVKVFLYPEADKETHVWVDTDLSFVGMAGQQSWDKQVLTQMTNLLCAPVSGGAR